MTVPFTCELQETTLVICGYLDEHATFPQVTDITSVNMQSISGFSSLGLKHLMQFLYSQMVAQIGLLECPVSFIESINAISGLIKGQKISVESLLLPCRCGSCSLEFETLIRTEDVVVGAKDIAFPQPRCHNCGDHLTVLVDPWEYFLFLYN